MKEWLPFSVQPTRVSTGTHQTQGPCRQNQCMHHAYNCSGPGPPGCRCCYIIIVACTTVVFAGFSNSPWLPLPIETRRNQFRRRRPSPLFASIPPIVRIFAPCGLACQYGHRITGWDHTLVWRNLVVLCVHARARACVCVCVCVEMWDPEEIPMQHSPICSNINLHGHM